MTHLDTPSESPVNISTMTGLRAGDSGSQALGWHKSLHFKEKSVR